MYRRVYFTFIFCLVYFFFLYFVLPAATRVRREHILTRSRTIESPLEHRTRRQYYSRLRKDHLRRGCRVHQLMRTLPKSQCGVPFVAGVQIYYRCLLECKLRIARLRPRKNAGHTLLKTLLSPRG